jgi:hypothetical protein
MQSRRRLETSAAGLAWTQRTRRQIETEALKRLAKLREMESVTL